MGDVVALSTPEPNGAPDRPPRELFGLASRLLAWTVLLLAAAVGVFMTITLVLGLACGGALLSMGPDAAYLGTPPNLPGIVPFETLPASTRAAYAATLILDWSPLVFVLTELATLLRRFGAGQSFGAGHGGTIKRMALGLGAYALAPAVGRCLVLATGHGVDTAWFHASAIHAVVLAAVLWLFAEVMDAGHDAEQDRGGFV